MALTPEERAIVEYGTKQGKSKEEILAALTAYRAKQIKREPGGVVSRAIKDIPQDIAQTVSEAKQSITQAGTGVVKELQSDRPLLDRLVGAGSEVFRGIGRTIGAVAGGALRLPFTQQFESKAAQTLEDAVAKAVLTAPVQSVARWYASQPESVQHNIRSALGYAEGLAAIAGGGRLVGVAERQLSAGMQKAQQAAQAVKAGAQRVSEVATGAKNVVSNIARPVVEKVRELAKSPSDDIAKLAESGDVEALKQAHLKAIDDLAGSLDQSAQRSAAAFRSLNTLARLQSTPETPVDRPALLKALIAEGVVPELDGDRLSFSAALKRIAQERERVVQQQIEPVLKELTDRGVKVPISQLEKQAQAIAKEAAVGAELPRVQRQVSAILKGYAAKYGKRLTPEQLNRMRVELNRLTRAYRNNELYKADAADIVAKAVRNTLYPMDERIVPAVQQVERLQIAEKVAKRLEGIKVEPGLFAGALGRYLATVGAGAFGGAIVAGGPGSLVLAGLVATLGEKATVELFLKKKLPKDIVEQISKALEANPQLREQLVKAGLPKTFNRQNTQLPAELFGVAAGFQQDPETGEIRFDPTSALVGILAFAASKKAPALLKNLEKYKLPTNMYGDALEKPPGWVYADEAVEGLTNRQLAAWKDIPSYNVLVDWIEGYGFRKPVKRRIVHEDWVPVIEERLKQKAEKAAGALKRAAQEAKEPNKVAEALYVINKAAKQARDKKNQWIVAAYEDPYLSNLPTNRIHEILHYHKAKQQQYYDLKERALEKLVQDLNLKPVGYHRFPDGQPRDMYRIGDWEFHTNTHTSDNYLGSITGAISSEKEKSRMSLQRAETILQQYLKTPKEELKPLTEAAKPSTATKKPSTRTITAYTDDYYAAENKVWAEQDMFGRERPVKVTGVFVEGGKVLPVDAIRELHKRLGLEMNPVFLHNEYLREVRSVYDSLLRKARANGKTKQDVWQAFKDVLGYDGFSDTAGRGTYYVVFQELN